MSNILMPSVQITKDVPFMYQRRKISEYLVEVRIDSTIHPTVKAQIIRSLFVDNWYYILEDNGPYWVGNTNMLDSKATTHEQCFNDLLAYIRGN